jgi:hypothetical protein
MSSGRLPHLCGIPKQHHCPCLEQHHLVWHAHLKLAFVNENAHTPEEKVRGELTKMLAYLQQSLPCVALQGSKAQVGL